MHELGSIDVMRLDQTLGQSRHVGRADLKVGDQVTLPKTLVTNTAQAQSSLINQGGGVSG